VRYPWGSVPILALLAGSTGLWALFGLRFAHASEPFIPLAVLRQPVVAGNVAAGFFSIGTIVGLSIYLPLYLELVRGASASQSGALLIAFTGGTVCGAFAGGRSLGFNRPHKPLPVAGLMLAMAALAVLAVAPTLSNTGVAVLLFLCGAGIGPMYPITTVLTQNAVRAHQFGVVTGTLNFFRLLGGTIVVAAFGAIILGHIDGSGQGAVLDQWLRSAPSAAASANTDAAHIFAIVFAAAGACLAAALIAFSFVEERPLRGPADANLPARPPFAAE
jgi:predicted MFS family arabinose efflux permease